MKGKTEELGMKVSERERAQENKGRERERKKSWLDQQGEWS